MISESVYRSGSAPVEGSLSASGGLFGGHVSEELRLDPAYVSYYYANVNLNPRLPPPLQGRCGEGGSRFGGIGDFRKASNGSRFIGEESENGKVGGEWGGDGLIGLQNTMAGFIQEDISHTTSVPRLSSLFISRNSLDSNFAESCFGQHQEPLIMDALHPSLSRSITPDPQLLGRVPSPFISPIGRNTIDKRNVPGPNIFDYAPAATDDPSSLLAALSSMKLLTNGVVASRSHQNFFPLQDYKKANSFISSGSSSSDSHSLDSPNSLCSFGFGGYRINPGSPSMTSSPTSNLPPFFENAAAASMKDIANLDSRGFDLGPNLLSAAVELQSLNRGGNRNVDPRYLQYLRRNQFATAALDDPIMVREGIERAYMEAMLLSQKAQFGHHFHGNMNKNCYYRNQRCGVSMSYPVIPNSPARYVERSMMGFPSGFRKRPGGMMGSWNPDVDASTHESFISSLLDEFKSNKTKCFELSEIAGNIVEFSADQYGSRFIQQKLETATSDEKKLVFDEIMPQALSLMTDVFGNYVVQKFFEHGTPSQIRELANQLIGHVLTFSLQMYGCRVIQKAIEVVELDLQKKMVTELDGHIMRCIRDQNGNHVIQKCIECIPEDAIQFVITVFYDQVVTLSTHPYGCRVIQRVLEHCRDLETQSKVMDEIMKSVCSLAQDQYGNYVVQHVLEHGKPDECSAIINKLIGQIVHMSQQKFASNVIEKCLTFGSPSERQTLVNEMLGFTDENDPLQVMMKDQFANYVVQKVVETCDDHQLESILNRIKEHLNTLKKYTYGKHIVARVEKLVVAGERRINGLMLPKSALDGIAKEVSS